MMTMTHKFVNTIPETIEEGIVYVSIPYETVIHKCCCGCGNEVVTPLSPTDWKLTFDGESITLYPSIGNWSFDCRSHYFIEKNKVVWSTSYSAEEIKKVRKVDSEDKYVYYEKERKEKNEFYKKTEKVEETKSFWRRFFSKWLS